MLKLINILKVDDDKKCNKNDFNIRRYKIKIKKYDDCVCVGGGGLNKSDTSVFNLRSQYLLHNIYIIY